MFGAYFFLGFEHLLDPEAYDHILFLAVLCAACPPARWRELLVLVTAFTVGHSLSLALATAGWVRVRPELVEFFILLTIVAAAGMNLAAPESALRTPSTASVHPPPFVGKGFRYAAVLLFGVIHGLGFSRFLRLALGGDRSLVIPLLSFNIGLEIAQLLVVAAGLGLAYVAMRVPRMPKAWPELLSAAVGVTAGLLAVTRWPF